MEAEAGQEAGPEKVKMFSSSQLVACVARSFNQKGRFKRDGRERKQCLDYLFSPLHSFQLARRELVEKLSLVQASLARQLFRVAYFARYSAFFFQIDSNLL